MLDVTSYRIYQLLRLSDTVYLIQQTTITFDKFLKARSEGNINSVEILRPLALRYFSPSELLRIFAFNPPGLVQDSTFVWPEGISNKSKYRLIGNSVNVKVVQELIEYLFCENSLDVSYVGVWNM